MDAETIAARLLWKHVYRPALAVGAAWVMFVAAILLTARVMIYGR